MKINLHLHLGEDETHYKIEDEIVYLKYISRKVDSEGVYEEKEYLDKFDFSKFEDGELMFNDPETFEELMETKLPINPIISAKREDGELLLELIYWQEQDFTEIVQDYFKWISPDELVITNDFDLMDITEEAKMVWKSNKQMLMNKKEAKKNELSQKCHEAIVSLFEVEIGGMIYGFSYDMEAQTNMQETYQMFQNNVINEISWSARINSEKVRVALNKSKFEKVYYEGIKHKQALISKLKDKLEPLVDSTKSEEELNSINWDMEDVDSVELNTGETMDKNIQSLEISREMSDTALMEFVNMVMMGMM